MLMDCDLVQGHFWFMEIDCKNKLYNSISSWRFNQNTPARAKLFVLSTAGGQIKLINDVKKKWKEFHVCFNTHGVMCDWIETFPYLHSNM